MKTYDLPDTKHGGGKDMNFPELIKQVRDELYETQAEFGKRFEVSRYGEINIEGFEYAKRN